MFLSTCTHGESPIKSKLRRLQIVSVFLFFSFLQRVSLTCFAPNRFWKRKDAATPIENGGEEEDSSVELN